MGMEVQDFAQPSCGTRGTEHGHAMRDGLDSSGNHEYVLDLFEAPGTIRLDVKNKGRGAMQCRQCGGPMMPETVIKLRRGLFGFRETRFQGAYCPTCRIGVTLGRVPAVPPPRPVSAASARRIGSVWPVRPPLRVSPASAP